MFGRPLRAESVGYEQYHLVAAPAHESVADHRRSKLIETTMRNLGIDSNVVNWQAGAFSTRERYDAWVHTVNQTYGSWDMRPKTSDNYFASLTTKAFDDFSIADCICDPCTGKRGPGNVAKDDREVLAIQLTLDGLEYIRYGTNEYVLKAGDIIVWDNTQRMSFQVEEKLHKISIILPLRRLKDWMPTNWHSIPRKIAGGSSNGALLTSYILSLSENDFGDSNINGDALSEAAVALLASALNQKPFEAPCSLKESQLERVKTYVAKNLDDPKLTLAAIAQANNISLRYLHWLFESTDSTAYEYVLEERLARCRRDLMNPLMLDRTIADIAFSWGFNDPTHFSRRFKGLYGECPSELRIGA